MEGLNTNIKNTLVINLDQIKDYEIQLGDKNFIFNIEKLFELGVLIDKNEQKEEKITFKITTASYNDEIRIFIYRGIKIVGLLEKNGENHIGGKFSAEETKEILEIERLLKK